MFTPIPAEKKGAQRWFEPNAEGSNLIFPKSCLIFLPRVALVTQTLHHFGKEQGQKKGLHGVAQFLTKELVAACLLGFDGIDADVEAFGYFFPGVSFDAHEDNPSLFGGECLDVAV